MTGKQIADRIADRIAEKKAEEMTDKKAEKQIATQISRVREMETFLNKSDAAFKALAEALTGYEEILDGYQRLEDYYGGAEWRDDFEADEQGLLPADLKRGVLSEDAVYDLIYDHKKLLIRMSHLVYGFHNE